MQFMVIMMPGVYRDNKKFDKKFVPKREEMEEMGRFNEELSKHVKILSLNGLHPLSTGARVAFRKGKATVTDGPFVETKEVFGGYWLVEADSKEQLVKLMQKCPAQDGDVIEIRQIFVDQTIGKYQQAVCIMRPYRWRHGIAAASMVGGNDQVILFLTYNSFNAVQKRHEEIVMQIVE